MKKYYVVQIGAEYPWDDMFWSGHNYKKAEAAAKEFANDPEYDGQEIRISVLDEFTDDKGHEKGYCRAQYIYREGDC